MATYAHAGHLLQACGRMSSARECACLARLLSRNIGVLQGRAHCQAFLPLSQASIGINARNARASITRRPPVLLRACATMAARACSPMEEQFEAFRAELDESNGVREKLRSVVADLDSAIRLMNAALLPVHHSASNESIEKAKGHLPAVRKAYAELKDIIKARPDEYYRYHDHWRSQTQGVVSLLAFLHWLETGNLLPYKEAEALLALKPEEFFLDLDDYLVGLCNMSNELPRYVVNQVITGAYDCPQKVSQFLSDFYAAFRILNLRNDHLRKRFDGIKYDLKKVEEILYDVKIRGLLSSTGSS